MLARKPGYKIAHLCLRVIAVLNVVYFASSALWPSLVLATTRGRVGEVVVKWGMASSVLLPVYVGLEMWWMGRTAVERTALVIDWLLAIAWFLFFWGGVLYAFWHGAII